MPLPPAARGEGQNLPLRRHCEGVDHIAVPALDAGVPASVSRPVVQGLLRDQMGFAGLVVSEAPLVGDSEVVHLQ